MCFYIVKISCKVSKMQTQIGYITPEEFEKYGKELTQSYRIHHIEKSADQEEIDRKNIGRLYLLKKQINKAILKSDWETGASYFIIEFPNLYLSSEFTPNLKAIIEDVFNENFFTDKPNQLFRVGNIVGLYQVAKPNTPNNSSSWPRNMTSYSGFRKLEMNSSYENLKQIKVGCFIITPKKLKF